MTISENQKRAHSTKVCGGWFSTSGRPLTQPEGDTRCSQATNSIGKAETIDIQQFLGGDCLRQSIDSRSAAGGLPGADQAETLCSVYSPILADLPVTAAGLLPPSRVGGLRQFGCCWGILRRYPHAARVVVVGYHYIRYPSAVWLGGIVSAVRPPVAAYHRATIPVSCWLPDYRHSLVLPAIDLSPQRFRLPYHFQTKSVCILRLLRRLQTPSEKVITR